MLAKVPHAWPQTDQRRRESPDNRESSMRSEKEFPENTQLSEEVNKLTHFGTLLIENTAAY